MPTAKEPWTDEQLVDLIENEGLGYAVYGYLGADSVADPITKELWQDAYEALNALAMHLDVGY